MKVLSVIFILIGLTQLSSAAALPWKDHASLRSKYRRLFQDKVTIMERVASQRAVKVQLAANEVAHIIEIRAKASGAISLSDLRDAELELARQRGLLMNAEIAFREAQSFLKIVEASIASGVETPIVLSIGLSGE